MYIAIATLIEQVPVSGKIVSFGMFENQNPVGFQQVVSEQQIRYFFDMRHIIRRIGKNNVILQFANRQEMERVVADNPDLAEPKFAGGGANESRMAGGYFNGVNGRAAARSKLVTDAPAT